MLRPARIVGLLSLVATPLSGQGPAAAATKPACPVDTLGLRPVGPTMLEEDAGKIYSSLVSPDGGEFFFFKRVGPGEEDYRIFRAQRLEHGWSSPEPVDLGASPSDLYPSLSPDGQVLVFSSYRPVPGDTSAHPNAHLWMARRAGAGWSTPSLLPASRLGFYHSGLRQDASGNLHLRVTTPDWSHAESMQLRRTGTGFAARLEPESAPAADYWAQRLGDSLHVWGEVTGPDGLALLQISRVDSATSRRGPGQYFITQRRGSAWTPLVRAGGGLGSGAPNFARFTPDGCYLEFTRDYSSFLRVPVALARAGG